MKMAKERMKVEQDKLKLLQDAAKLEADKVATEKEEKEEGKTSRANILFGGRRPVTPQGQALPMFDTRAEKAAANEFARTGQLGYLNFLKPQQEKGPFVVGKNLVSERGIPLFQEKGSEGQYNAILSRIKTQNPNMPEHAQGALAYFESRGIKPTADVVSKIYGLGEENKSDLSGKEYANLVTAIYGKMTDITIERFKEKSKETNIFGRKKGTAELVLPDISQATELADHVLGKLGKNAKTISLQELVDIASQSMVDTRAQAEFNALPEEDKKTVLRLQKEFGISLEEALFEFKDGKEKAKSLILSPHRPFPEE